MSNLLRANPVTRYGADAPFTEMYDLDLNVQQVKDTLVSNKRALGWSQNLPTVVVTGTAIAGGVLESAIVTGGETLILTLTHGTWDTDVLAQLEVIGAAVVFNGSVAAGTGWDAEVAGNSDLESDAVRTDDVTITYTTPAAGSYAISGDETVTFAIPRNLVRINGQQLTASGNLTCSPATFVITNEA